MWEGVGFLFFVNVTTSVARTNTSGSGAVVTRVNNTRYDVRGPIDNVMLLTFTATDRYGRTATMSMYVNVRTVLSPVASGVSVNQGGFHRGHIDSLGNSGHTYPQWSRANSTATRAWYPPGTNIPNTIVYGTIGSNKYGANANCVHILTKTSSNFRVVFHSIVTTGSHTGNVSPRTVSDVPGGRFTGRGVPAGYTCTYRAAQLAGRIIYDYPSHSGSPPGDRLVGSGTHTWRIDIVNEIGETKRLSLKLNYEIWEHYYHYETA